MSGRYLRCFDQRRSKWTTDGAGRGASCRSVEGGATPFSCSRTRPAWSSSPGSPVSRRNVPLLLGLPLDPEQTARLPCPRRNGGALWRTRTFAQLSCRQQSDLCLGHVFVRGQRKANPRRLRVGRATYRVRPGRCLPQASSGPLVLDHCKRNCV